MKKVSLQVNERKVLGKKVKKLRKEGLLPANVYGKEVKSLAVELPTKEFEKTFKEVGETGLVELKVDGQMKPVLIHNVQYDPVSHEPLHADFYQVNLKEKVKTSVPVSFVGEPQAIINKVGILLEQISELEVEALPTDLPENIEVNVEKLANVDDQITVAEIKAPAGVTILSDASQVVAKIGELVTKEAAQQAAAEAAAAEAAKAATAEAAPAEGGETPATETPAETPAGEVPASQEKPEEKTQ